MCSTTTERSSNISSTTTEESSNIRIHIYILSYNRRSICLCCVVTLLWRHSFERFNFWNFNSYFITCLIADLENKQKHRLGICTLVIVGRSQCRKWRITTCFPGFWALLLCTSSNHLFFTRFEHLPLERLRTNSVVTHSYGEAQNKNITVIRKNTLDICAREKSQRTLKR